MTELNVVVSFPCKATTHTRAEFQDAGHFVPGHVTGIDVVALSLMHPKAEGLGQGKEGGPWGGQILRVLANTLDEAVGLMSAAIHQELYIQWHANQMSQFDRTQFLHLNERLNQLAQYMTYHYPEHSGFGVAAEIAAMDRLDQSRNTLWAKVSGWFQPAKPQPQTQPRGQGRQEQQGGYRGE